MRAGHGEQCLGSPPFPASGAWGLPTAPPGDVQGPGVPPLTCGGEQSRGRALSTSGCSRSVSPSPALLLSLFHLAPTGAPGDAQHRPIPIIFPL